jgi:hypothetical protein
MRNDSVQQVLEQGLVIELLALLSWEPMEMRTEKKMVALLGVVHDAGGEAVGDENDTPGVPVTQRQAELSLQASECVQPVGAVQRGYDLEARRIPWLRCKRVAINEVRGADNGHAVRALVTPGPSGREDGGLIGVYRRAADLERFRQQADFAGLEPPIIESRYAEESVHLQEI